MKFKFKMNLLVKILIAIVAGILAGQFLPVWAGRIFATFNAIFSQFLSFIVPLIILGFVIPAIADVGKNAGKILLITAVIAYIFTSLSGFFSYAVGSWLFPGLVSPMEVTEQMKQGADLTPIFTITMPPLLDVMSALVLSFLLGISLAYLDTPVLRKAAGEFNEVVSKTIYAVIIPLLPLYIFGIFLNMTVAGQVMTVLKTFAAIIGIIFVMHIVLLIFQYCVASCFSHANPFRSLLTMMPAYFTALGTQSSAATIPVTLRQTIKMGVKEDIAGFVIPLCATIHMSGSAMKITACALAIIIMQGLPVDPIHFTGFILMLGITMVAAPGVPGGSIMAALGLLSGFLGFDEQQLALMIALYIAMDSFGTACNVTGDGAIAQIINRYFGSGILKKNPS